MRIPVAFNRRAVHLINPMVNFFGGSEHRTLELYRHLEKIRPRKIWCPGVPHPEFSRIANPVTIRAEHLRFPMRGTVTFVSSYFYVGGWLRFSRPERVVIICNLPDAEKFWKMHNRICKLGHKEIVKVGYASAWLREKIGLPGPIALSPVNITTFRPGRKTEGARPFTVGRLSRDVAAKHHEDDPELYAYLASNGIRVRIMGGTCLARHLTGVSNIELLPMGHEAPEVFLQSLDVFFYRTSAERPEPHGRVVTEALACGLPIVVDPAGGVGEWVEDGVTGFSIVDNRSATSAIMELAANEELRSAMSVTARAKAEAVFSDENIRRNLIEVLGP